MDILNALFYMLNEMSPYILLGLLVAGLMHSFIPAGTMSRHLSGTGWKPVIKAALIGVPLPLCSCGVLPAAVAMKRSGASNAASSSFLIATPQTGVDSIAATYSLLGPAFAVVRPIAALATAIAGGYMVGRNENAYNGATCPIPSPTDTHKQASFVSRLGDALRYGFIDMVRRIGKWLIAGLVIAALITVAVPADFFVSLNRYPLLAMACVVIVAIPMYVCATGSIPIALSLMLKGLSPGTALVLLMAGPAANFASITVISRNMGRRCATVYLSAIITGAIVSGLIIDYLLPASWFALPAVDMHMACHTSTGWFELTCSGILLILLSATAIYPLLHKKPKIDSIMKKEYKIKGMSCPHCKASVEKALGLLHGVTAVDVDLRSGIATVEGAHDEAKAIEAIQSLGFDYEPQ